jgi:hypothetical protein
MTCCAHKTNCKKQWKNHTCCSHRHICPFEHIWTEDCNSEDIKDQYEKQIGVLQRDR